MKKQIISLIILALLPMVASADAVEIGGIYYNLVPKANGAEVTQNPNMYIGAIEIPKKVTYDGVTYDVTTIGARAFGWCTDLTIVTIPNSVTSIGYEAFYGCTGLTSVTIPNSVTSIGSEAFYECTGLTSVTIPNSVTSIGGSAFYGCTGLTSVSIGNSVNSIGYYAFEGCSGLTSVTIPNSVTSIGGDAFKDCSGLTEVSFNATNCKSMGNYNNLVFNNCTSLTTLNLGDGVQTIPDYAFACLGLKSVTIPNSVINIGKEAFSFCTGLTSVTIPNSVTSIGESAFECCRGLKSVTIPNSVASIGGHAFKGCTSLTSVTIPNSVKAINAQTFSGCTGLTSVTIPNSVTSIGWLAFKGCTGLTSVTIGNSVTIIYHEAFKGCTSLTSVTIPNSVTSIGAITTVGETFYGCTSLTSVTIGNSIKSIYKSSFASCPELTDVYCYAENVPNTEASAFSGSYIEYATLHVPASAIESYRTTAPWSSFKIVAIDSSEPPTPEVKKCATPTIAYINGKLKFTSETEGAEFMSEVTVADAKKYYDAEVPLLGVYHVTAYATKPGYDNSEIATADFVIKGSIVTLVGDVNNDGKVDATDITKLIEILLK